MKNDILPKWDSKENLNGGTWSLKIVPSDKEKKLEDIVYQVWEKATIQIINNILIEENDNINGISIQIKNRSNCGILQIWCNHTKLKLDNFLIENVDMENIERYFKVNNNRRDKFKEYRKRKF